MYIHKAPIWPGTTTISTNNNDIVVDVMSIDFNPTVGSYNNSRREYFLVIKSEHSSLGVWPSRNRTFHMIDLINSSYCHWDSNMIYIGTINGFVDSTNLSFPAYAVFEKINTQW